MRSIRARLLLGLLGSMLIVQVLIYVLIYARIEDEIDDLFDGELERSALAYSTGTALLPVSTPRRQVVDPQEGMIVSIWGDSGNSPQFQSGKLDGVSRATPAGFSKAMFDGRQWRLFGAPSGDRFVVAAQPGDVRNVAARKITLRILLPSLAAVPVAGFMILIAVSFGLRRWCESPRICARVPTGICFAHRCRALGSRYLPGGACAQRADASPGGHHRSAAQLHRGCRARAATPLTALRLQTQMLVRAESAHRQREAIGELQGGVSRTLQLARQLLTLARHGGDADDQPAVRVDLEQLARNVLAIHQPLAQAKSIRTEISGQGTCAVMGSEEGLNTMVSNLIENAIKYTDIGGAVRIHVQPAAGQVWLDIEDSGPGIAPEERERVFDRFYRRRSNTASGQRLGFGDCAGNCLTPRRLDHPWRLERPRRPARPRGLRCACHNGRSNGSGPAARRVAHRSMQRAPRALGLFSRSANVGPSRSGGRGWP